MGLIIKEPPTPNTRSPCSPIWYLSGSKVLQRHQKLHRQWPDESTVQHATRLLLSEAARRKESSADLYGGKPLPGDPSCKFCVCVVFFIPAEVFVKQLYSQCQLQPTIFLPLDWLILEQSTSRREIHSRLCARGFWSCVPFQKIQSNMSNFHPVLFLQKGPPNSKGKPGCLEDEVFFQFEVGRVSVGRLIFSTP